MVAAAGQLAVAVRAVQAAGPAAGLEAAAVGVSCKVRLAQGALALTILPVPTGG